MLFYFLDKDSSFNIYAVMYYARGLLFNSMHKDWYICESKKPDRHGPELVLDFYNGDPDVLTRCSFIIQPLQQNEDKLQNCKNVIGPVEHPAINGQPLPHPPHLVPHTPPPPFVLPACIPTCSAGGTGETQAGQESTDTSALTIPSSTETSGLPGVPDSDRKSLFIFQFLCGLEI